MPRTNNQGRRLFKRAEVAWVAQYLGVETRDALRIMVRVWRAMAGAYCAEYANGLTFRVTTTEALFRTRVVVSLEAPRRNWSGRNYNQNYVQRRYFANATANDVALTHHGDREVNRAGNGVNYLRGPARRAS